MPIEYHTAANGTRYPVYSGADFAAEVGGFYRNHAARFGLTRAQVMDLQTGQGSPVSPLLVSRIAAAKSGVLCCQAFPPIDPRAVRVGDVLPSVAASMRPALGYGPAVPPVPRVRLSPSVGLIPLVARPAPRPASGLSLLLVLACALVMGLGAYALVKKYAPVR